MANICNNELRVFTESTDNIEAITKFFNERYPHSHVDKVGDYNLTVYFESRWSFPEEDMEDLTKSLPDDDITMDCLSVDWGTYYCVFYSYRDGEWVVN